MAEISSVNGAIAGEGDTPVEASPCSPESPSSAGITISPVMPGALGAAWPQVKRMVREAVRWSPFTRKLQTINDVEARIYAGEYRLWLVFRDNTVIAALVTHITQEIQCKVLDVVYGAGDHLEEWIEEFYVMMDDLATELDCKFIRIEGRKGWGPMLGKLGFEEAYRAYMIEV